jgi:cytosine/adenosine deaminase-related metal-dependent hydrolase
VLAEARHALLLQRVKKGAEALTVMEALQIATIGSAEVIGREDLGRLAEGMAADLIGYRTDTLAFAGGAIHDPVASLLLCTPQGVDLSILNGQIVVEQGQLTTLELPPLIERHNQIARQMAAKHPLG